MAKQSQQRQKSDTHYPPESPVAEGTTVAWMVSVMIVVLLDLFVIGLHIYLAAGDDPGPRVKLGAAYALATAAITGIVSLALALAARKLRVIPPPPRVTAFSVFVAAAPIVGFIVSSLS